FVLLHTVPVLYEKYEDKVDPFAEKAAIEIKKQYAVFDAKVLSKIPMGPLKAKKDAGLLHFLERPEPLATITSPPTGRAGFLLAPTLKLNFMSSPLQLILN
ncbi:hypothetical protein Gorai_014845, partial [Gossypium raimondii]|nr:hypothetical protein [Gossypium raimondii]